MTNSKFLFSLGLICFIVLLLSNNLFAQKTIVADKPENVSPLATGEKIPEISVKNPSGDLVNLQTIAGEKQTILIFFRGGWCPFCNRHLKSLQKIQKDITGLGYQLVAISADSPDKLSKLKTEDKLDYTLLSDYNSGAATAFGIAYKVDDETYETYKKNKVDLEKHSGNTNHILPVSSVFILSTDGTIKYAYYSTNFTVLLDANEILENAKSNKE